MPTASQPGLLLNALPETEGVQRALSSVVKGELLKYEADGGPLSKRDVKAIGSKAKAALPKGQILSKKSLF